MSKNIFNLNDTTVLVTGATGYLGRQVCFGLLESGATVLVNSRSNDKALELVNELLTEGGNAQPAVFDITSTDEIESFMSNYTGELNVIINNAYAGGSGTIETSKDDAYNGAYKVVVEATHNLFNYALPLLRNSVQKIGYASVINIASMYGSVSPDLRVYPSKASSNPPFYGAAKAALIQWTKYAACEFGHENIRVNSISPGPFPNIQINSNDFVTTLSAKVPMRRVGRADEIRGPVVFLASNASSFVNGCNLAVDGGWTAW